MKVAVEFTGIELDHLLTLLRDSSREGSYYGQRRHYYKRRDRLFARLEKAWETLKGRDGWPLPSVENRRSQALAHPVVSPRTEENR